MGGGRGPCGARVLHRGRWEIERAWRRRQRAGVAEASSPPQIQRRAATPSPGPRRRRIRRWRRRWMGLELRQPSTPVRDDGALP
jgi:hypothetical protein